MMKKTPLVSICCLAFNTEKYIAQTLEGFIMQKTNFPFEIIVHDDASPDRTGEIILQYARKYPELIIPIFQKENQYYNRNKGGTNLTKFMLPLTSGKYIAMCEGDDYWINPLKLQTQVDFMEAHPDYNFSVGRVDVLTEKTGIIRKMKDPVNPDKKDTYLLKDYLKTPFSQTSSFVFRNTGEDFPEWFAKVHAEDRSLVIVKTGKGKIKYHPELFSIYRIHETSITFTARYNIYERFIETLISWKLYLGKEYKKIIEIMISIMDQKNKLHKSGNIVEKSYYAFNIKVLNLILKLL
jgi:glycosyltransferase involved in cell wall biosynthesis